jgi:hypothetical protein
MIGTSSCPGLDEWIRTVSAISLMGKQDQVTSGSIRY